MADDTQQGEWQAATEDCPSPEQPSVGEWRECADTDPTYLELAAYSAFRAALYNYMEMMWAGDVIRPRLPKNIKDVLDKLDDDKNAYPLAWQLLHDRMGFDAEGQQARVIRYHTSYNMFSDSGPFSRSAMLAGFMEVMDLVNRTEPDFRAALHRLARGPHDTDYTSLVAAYTKWHDMAVESIKKDSGLYAHVKQRELSGPRGPGRRALMEMRALLAGMRG